MVVNNKLDQILAVSEQLEADNQEAARGAAIGTGIILELKRAAEQPRRIKDEEPVKMQHVTIVSVLPALVKDYLDDGWTIIDGGDAA